MARIDESSFHVRCQAIQTQFDARGGIGVQALKVGQLLDTDRNRTGRGQSPGRDLTAATPRSLD